MSSLVSAINIRHKSGVPCAGNAVVILRDERTMQCAQTLYVIPGVLQVALVIFNSR